jgi:hypothetical protein
MIENLPELGHFNAQSSNGFLAVKFQLNILKIVPDYLNHYPRQFLKCS